MSVIFTELSFYVIFHQNFHCMYLKVTNSFFFPFSLKLYYLSNILSIIFSKFVGRIFRILQRFFVEYFPVLATIDKVYIETPKYMICLPPSRLWIKKGTVSREIRNKSLLSPIYSEIIIYIINDKSTPGDRTFLLTRLLSCTFQFPNIVFQEANLKSVAVLSEKKKEIC